ncbi:16S rRNA (uracil(1498)-N(3))-methyltransferase [bacterium]|nr:16S rRNA (uracil(1498)-N(3))-methyltransferase [bacterium]
MRLTRIYTPQNLAKEEEFILSGEGANHLLKSMRLGVGDKFVTFDGSGAEYLSQVESIEKKASLRASILKRTFPQCELSVYVRICLACVKGERFDWAVEKLTELGVSEIVPIVSRYTQVEGLSAHKLERCRRLIIEAAQQCGRVKLPSIEPSLSFQEALLSYSNRGGKIILFQPHNPPFTPDPSVLEYTIFIGPEGGFSEEELSLAAELCQFWGLGECVLRVETAALVAMAKFI